MCNFHCFLDEDIEKFLREKAIDFEKRKWCRTYLILNENDFANGIINVEAYFTLSHKTIVPNTSVSNSTKRKIGRGIKSELIQMVLIGQLGKYNMLTPSEEKVSSKVTSKKILDLAFEIIQKADELIPCPAVLVECNHNPNVQKVYIDYGFKQFQEGTILDQFYKLI